MRKSTQNQFMNLAENHPTWENALLFFGMIYPYHSLPKTQRKLTRYNIIVVKMQLYCRSRTVLKQKTTTKLSTGPLWQLIRKVLRFALLAVTPTNGQHQARKWEMRLWLAVATGRQLLGIIKSKSRCNKTQSFNMLITSTIKKTMCRDSR